ncbi:hypothetical protein AGMMS50212_15380 [Spirochaetia bacterium]|nr:hypothetical protein AGMMS50212_15380 [Spirochaetia bacterium]
MNDEQTKIVDCVQFKHDLHEKLFRKSGANNLREYIQYINAAHTKQHPVQVIKKSDHAPVVMA